MKDSITTALGLPDLSPGDFHDVRKRILTDNFIYSRCLCVLIEENAARILDSSAIHPVERAALLKKFLPLKPSNIAIWSVSPSATTGHVVFAAHCATCHLGAHFVPPVPKTEVEIFGGRERTKTWPLTPKDVRRIVSEITFAHCGKKDRPDELWLSEFQVAAMANVNAD